MCKLTYQCLFLKTYVCFKPILFLVALMVFIRHATVLFIRHKNCSSAAILVVALELCLIHVKSLISQVIISLVISESKEKLFCKNEFTLKNFKGITWSSFTCLSLLS